jgi:hypothetical protein
MLNVPCCLVRKAEGVLTANSIAGNQARRCRPRTVQRQQRTSWGWADCLGSMQWPAARRVGVIVIVVRSSLLPRLEKENPWRWEHSMWVVKAFYCLVKWTTRQLGHGWRDGTREESCEWAEIECRMYKLALHTPAPALLKRPHTVVAEHIHKFSSLWLLSFSCT